MSAPSASSPPPYDAARARLLSAWGSTLPPAAGSACAGAPTVRIVSVDSRPLDSASPADSAPSLSAAINAAYAARHGYAFTYYRVHPLRSTAESVSGTAPLGGGGAKLDYCVRNGALGVGRRTPWCKLLVLWSLLQEEETAAACPASRVLYVDSDAIVTPAAGQAEALDAWLARTPLLRPEQEIAWRKGLSEYDAPRPPGGFPRWAEPAGWPAPAARLLFASCAPWWPAGPTSGTFVIDGVGSPAGRAAAAALLAAWWDTPQPDFTRMPAAEFMTFRWQDPAAYSWNEHHPYEQTVAAAAVDAAAAARLYALDADSAAAAVACEPLLALARHMRILETETFVDEPGQFLRHASSFDAGARMGLLRGAADALGLVGDALAAAVAAVHVVEFDAFAADARLRDDFAARTAALDVTALLATGDVVERRADAEPAPTCAIAWASRPPGWMN